MALELDRARVDDIDELLQLYFAVYGPHYPLPVGSDRAASHRAISSQEEYLWLVTRDTARSTIVGSCVFEMEKISKIGKVSGLVVHPEYRTRNIARQMVNDGVAKLFSSAFDINSIYATTRTVSVAPQLAFLRNSFLPLGIFPNAHKIERYETLTLLARYKPGVFDRRSRVEEIPEKISPITTVMKEELKLPFDARRVPQRMVGRGGDIAFEFIFAAEYVRRKWLATFEDPYDRFYPFHTPNLLISSVDGSIELYAYFNSKDHYCTLISANTPMKELEGRMGRVFEQLKEFGVSYVETLIGLRYTESIQSLLSMQFLPSAIYPAMEERDGKLHDFILLSRTMEPLNFSGMAIDSAFKPYVDQYVELWKQMLLETIEVFHEPNAHST
jgi:GNAT superfamily N-acetyltransferase